jgi:O-antigen ligase
MNLNMLQQSYLERNQWVNLLVVALALTLQILVTLSIGAAPIRVASADLLLPMMITVLMFQLKEHGSRFILWNVARVWKWLFALTLWITVSLLNGIYFTGGVQTWALVNKYFGWYVLLIFFVFGGLVGNSCSIKAKRSFLMLLFLASCVIGLVDSLSYIQYMRGYSEYFRVMGLAGNPNAYGFLLVVVMLVLIAYQHGNGFVIAKYFDIGGMGLLLALIVFSGSRSAWLGLLTGVLLLGLARRIVFRSILLATCVAVILVTAVSSAQVIERASWQLLSDVGKGGSAASIPPQAKVNPPYVMRSDLAKDSGVGHRLEIMENANALWIRDPVLGVGLGSFLWSESKAGRDSAIHSTAQWLLVETGVIGLLLFGGFMIDMLWQLWRRSKEAGSDWMIGGGIAVLAAFVGASVGFEAMYQRHVWFFLGWALACSNALQLPAGSRESS